MFSVFTIECSFFPVRVPRPRDFFPGLLWTPLSEPLHQGEPLLQAGRGRQLHKDQGKRKKKEKEKDCDGRRFGDGHKERRGNDVGG